MLKRVEKLTRVEEAMLAAATQAPASAARDSAVALLRERGLPTRRVEAWHYTDLRNLIKGFPGLVESASKPEVEAWLGSTTAIIPSARLSFLNGRLVVEDAMPAGVTAKAASPATGFRDASDMVGIVNAMFASRGVEIVVADGAQVEAPVELLHGMAGEGAAALRHSVKIGAGAKAVVLERHVGRGGLASHSNTVTDLEVGDGGDLLWLFAQEEGEAATHLSQLNIRLGADAKLTLLLLNAGGALVRREVDIVSSGENSELSIRGVNLIGGTSHIDVTTVLRHEVPGVTANELFRNVATERGHGVFQGQIRVAKEAQKTDARMACNTLLLSDDAEFSAKPELEIFADDVQCGHGATVTDIVDEHLFYLRARGIPQREARSMLVQAFVQEVFDDLEDEGMRDALDARIVTWLENHG